MLQKTNPKDQNVLMKYYLKYEYLAEVYARSVFNSYKIAMDFEDLVQEFKFKIYTAIIGYGKKWAAYKETGRYKPISIEMYIKSSLNNKKKDLFRSIDEAPYNVSVEDTGFDYSEVCSMHCRLSAKEGIAELNGINLIEGLTIVESK